VNAHLPLDNLAHVRGSRFRVKFSDLSPCLSQLLGLIQKWGKLTGLRLVCWPFPNWGIADDFEDSPRLKESST
jgi:hypothetical protein